MAWRRRVQSREGLTRRCSWAIKFGPAQQRKHLELAGLGDIGVVVLRAAECVAALLRHISFGWHAVLRDSGRAASIKASPSATTLLSWTPCWQVFLSNSCKPVRVPVGVTLFAPSRQLVRPTLVLGTSRRSHDHGFDLWPYSQRSGTSFHVQTSSHTHPQRTERNKEVGKRKWRGRCSSDRTARSHCLRFHASLAKPPKRQEAWTRKQ